jgi:hypothetical protein
MARNQAKQYIYRQMIFIRVISKLKLPKILNFMFNLAIVTYC